MAPVETNDLEARLVDYLKLSEISRRLGVSEPTARRMVKSGRLPSVFIGNSYRVSEKDLERYLEDARVRPGKAPGLDRPPNAPAGPGKLGREDRVEELAARIEDAAQELREDVEGLIPAPGSPKPYNGAEIHALSRAAVREYLAYLAHVDDLDPEPGREIMALHGALARFWSAYRAGAERDRSRGGAWDRDPIGALEGATQATTGDNGQ